MTRRWCATVAAVAVLGAAAACGSGDDDSDVAQPSASTAYIAGDVPVLVPGAPNEPNEVIAPGGSGTLANPSAWTDVDVDFVTGMVPHHTQALEMADLAADRAQDERVVALAERISAAQGPEVEGMQAWLASQNLPSAPTEADADHPMHEEMAGMASPERMLELVAADGADFDRLFLQTMTEHHEGALVMAGAALGAQNPLVAAMVDDTVVMQSTEIRIMRDLLADLS